MQQPKQEKESGQDKGSRSIPPRVIAISSGKGGVGKSSITVNLGIALAKTGVKVCLLDADTGLANANILLGLTPQFSLEHVLYGAKSIEDVMMDGPHGMKIIPGANGISECVSLHTRQQLRLTRELARIESDFDYMLIDTAAGISDTTLDFVSAAHHTLIVITPEPTSLTDAFSLIKLLEKRRKGIDYHVVVNMCSSASQAKEVFSRFRSAVDKYISVNTDYLGHILRDESMRAAVVLQNPVAMFPETDPSCRSFIKLAESVESFSSQSEAPKSFSAYWHREFREQRIQHEASGQNAIRVVPELDSEVNRDSDYLSELRARVLLLIEQGHVDEQLISSMLQESVDTFQSRFDKSPVNILSLVDQLLDTQDRDDKLLRKIAERVEPWRSEKIFLPTEELHLPPNELSLKTKKAPTDNVTPESVVDDIEACSGFEEIIDARQVHEKSELSLAVDDNNHKQADESSVIHHYDVQRFGSQEHLLDLLQRRGDEEQTLAEFLTAFSH